MPRIARIDAPFCVHHVIFRFVNGQNRFDQICGARDEFLRRSELALKKVDWALLAFALMGNHGHLVFFAGIDPPAKLMQPLEAGFAGWFNRRMRQSGPPFTRTRGPVFADRFADIIVPPERAAIVVAYVHNNPVRARVVTSPENSDWTSHRVFIGLDKPTPYLHCELALKLCGLDDTQRGRTQFHDFVLSRLNDPKDPALSNEYAVEKRQRIRSSLKLPVELATGQCLAEGIQFEIVPKSLGAKEARYNGSPESALRKFSEYFGILPQQVQSRSRTRSNSCYRAMLVQAWVAVGRPIAEIAPLIGISHQAGSYLLQKPINPNVIKQLVKTLLV